MHYIYNRQLFECLCIWRVDWRLLPLYYRCIGRSRQTLWILSPDHKKHYSCWPLRCVTNNAHARLRYFSDGVLRSNFPFGWFIMMPQPARNRTILFWYSAVDEPDIARQMMTTGHAPSRLDIKHAMRFSCCLLVMLSKFLWSMLMFSRNPMLGIFPFHSRGLETPLQHILQCYTVKKTSLYYTAIKPFVLDTVFNAMIISR